MNGDEQKRGPLYWKSIEDLAGSPEVQAFVEDEFPHRAVDWRDPVSRRNALKVMGASLALAGVSACTKQPKEVIVPYVRQPEDFIPGRPLFYATAVTTAGVGAGLLVESHLGRPTKVEGNPDHPGSLGATDRFAQASVLTLWDPDRSQTVTHFGDISSWVKFVAALGAVRDVASLRNGAGLRILTETITSPTLAEQIRTLQKALPAVKWHQYEPVGRGNVGEGAKLAFGRYVNPVYHFDQADVVVSLDADFLNQGAGSVRYARDFADMRRVRTNVTHHPQPKQDRQEGYQAGSVAPLRNQAATHVEEDDSPSPNVQQVQAQGLPLDQTTQNRLYAVEPAPSITGGMADHRFAIRAGDIEGFAWALAAACGAAQAPAGVKTHKAIPAMAADMAAHKGRCLVVAGDFQPPAVHALAHLINQTLGNVGKTVTYTEPLEAEPVDPAESLRALVADILEEQVDALLILGGNPVYNAPADLDFTGALTKVKFRARLGLYEDETSAQCQWHIAEAHYLETWGDTRAYDGTVTVQQPLIAPLYDGRSALEVLAVLTSQLDKSAHDFVKGYWEAKHGAPDFGDFWQISLHNGVLAGSALPPVNVTAKAPAAASGASAQQALEIVFRPDPTIGDGAFSNNGWLQELPKPMTKITWDNAVWISPRTAARLGLNDEDVVELGAQGRAVKGPVWIVPGHVDDSVTVHLGYGRTRAGSVGTGIGFDAYALRTSDHLWHRSGIKIAKTGEKYPLASTQHMQSMDGREPVRAATIAEYIKNPQFADGKEGLVPDYLTLFPDYKYEGYKWGMSIDLNSCNGCGTCTIACQAENNIAVVGKEQVGKGRIMHWIRVDRYHEGSVDDPELYFQPVPCMHCENAPCELVCPVAATVHSGEGLNQMVYNRCVGTRYCSNNCPYKVRRFNFLLFSDFYTLSKFGLRNPDVTVRSRGVMEKCTYCVQRINSAKIQSEREDRRVRDGEITPACAQACPSQAIVFGDINDRDSRIANLKAQPRNYSVLEELNTRPRTTYLARLRNPNAELEKG